MTNMLRALRDKEDSMREHMSNIYREMKILKQEVERNASDQNAVFRMKSNFDWCISRLDTAEERIYEFKEISNETSKIEKPREQRQDKKNSEHPRTVEQL